MEKLRYLCGIVNSINHQKENTEENFMKKLLVMMLIGSMMFGISGCSGNAENNNDSKNETVDVTKEDATDATEEKTEKETEKETEEETTTEEETRTEEEKQVTVEELLEIMENTRYTKSVTKFESEASWFLMIDEDAEIFHEVPYEFVNESTECISNGISCIESKKIGTLDTLALKKLYKKVYIDTAKEKGEEWSEEEFEEIYQYILEDIGADAEGKLTEESEKYYEVENGEFNYIIKYNLEEEKWETEKQQIEDKKEDHNNYYNFKEQWFEDVVLTENEEGYIVSSYVDDTQTLYEEFKDSGMEVESGKIKIYFDKNKVFKQFVWEVECKEVSQENINDGDIIFNKATITFVLFDNFDEEIKLPEGVVLD